MTVLDTSDGAPPYRSFYSWEYLTADAKAVLHLASHEARAANHSYIGTEHLLLAMLRERNGAAGKLLAHLGVTIEAVNQIVEAVLGRNERIIIQQIIPTSRVKKVIELAFTEMRRSGQCYVGTDHLLLGLLIEGEGIAAHILEDLGINLDTVREALGLKEIA